MKALHFSVEDKQEIRFYDMNTISYDPQSRSRELQTGIPIQIEAVVGCFDLTAEETDTIVQG